MVLRSDQAVDLNGKARELPPKPPPPDEVLKVGDKFWYTGTMGGVTQDSKGVIVIEGGEKRENTSGSLDIKGGTVLWNNNYIYKALEPTEIHLDLDDKILKIKGKVTCTPR